MIPTYVNVLLRIWTRRELIGSSQHDSRIEFPLKIRLEHMFLHYSCKFSF